MSSATRELVEDDVDDGISLADLGTVRLTTIDKDDFSFVEITPMVRIR